MKKRIIAVISTLVFATILFSITALSSTTYTASLAFQGEHTGPKRDYTGSDMSWSGYTYTEYQNDFMQTTFKVSLYRKNLIGSSRIGTVTCSRTGNHTIVWTNVGDGKYYFYYTKDRDGANVCSDEITMSMS